MIRYNGENTIMLRHEWEDEHANICRDCGKEFQEVDICEADSNLICEGEDCPCYGDCNPTEGIACEKCGEIRGI